MNRHALAVLLALSPIAPTAFAADEVKSSTPDKIAAPATTDDVPSLIKQLGDDSPKVRDEAGAKLRKLGKAALPALEEAAKGDDPEVTARSQSIAGQIRQDLNPTPPAQTRNGGTIVRNGPMIRLGGGAIAGGNGNVNIVMTSTTVNSSVNKKVSVRTTNGVTVKETTVTEDGKTVKIVEDADGIAVTTTEKKDDKETSDTVKAKTADELKKDHPKAFEQYEKHAKDARVKIEGLNINGGNIRVENFDIGGDPDVQKMLDDARQRADAALKEAEKIRKQAERDAEKALEDAKAKAKAAE